MCGIAGYFAFRPSGVPKNPYDVLNDMVGAISHRGPDSKGVQVNQLGNVGFAHSRLSIRDLSLTGAQPMNSFTGRSTIVFNGEIYNPDELKREVEVTASNKDLSISWRGESDTEVLLNAIEVLGVERALELTNGMFAAAIWDFSLNRGFLIRDRSGEKPLLYTRINGALVFASELRSLIKYPGFSKTLDQRALTDYLKRGYVPDTSAIFVGVNKVPPGCLVVLDNETIGDPKPFPAYKRYLGCGGSSKLHASLHEVLMDSVEGQLLSDAPLGCFLSGGVDSSLITAIAAELTHGTLNTFTIGFENPAWDESDRAAAIARHLGVSNECKVLTHSDLLSSVESIGNVYDEPFADPSQIPTYLLSKFARTKTAVCLSGDGADELFLGYSRYFQLDKLWRYIGDHNKEARGMVSQALLGGCELVDLMCLHPFGSTRNPTNLNGVRAGVDRTKKSALLIASENFEECYERFLNIFPANCGVQINTDEKISENSVRSAPPLYDSDRRLEYMSQLDQRDYLVGNILVKVDRAAMANSLETRAPFLDPRVVSFASAMNIKDKTAGVSSGKAPLKKLLSTYLPQHLVEGPKKGFSVPLASWLRNELKGVVYEILSEEVIRREGIFDYKYVNRLIDDHCKRKYDNHRQLWTLLMFQMWAATLNR